MTEQILEKLQKYTEDAKPYPVATLEDFCNKKDVNILIVELYDLASHSVELSDAIMRFKQRQKSLILQLLTIKGNITLSDKETKNKQTVTLDKRGVELIARRYGII